MAYSGPWSAEYIESMYQRWKNDPDGVEKDWQFFFQGFELGTSRPQQESVTCDEDTMRKQSRVEALIYRYRDIGHLMSCLDPLESCPTDHPLLNISAFGLDEKDMETAFYVPGMEKGQTMPLKDILQLMKQTYSHSIGVEYMHLQDPHEREWLRERMESVKNQPNYGSDEKIRIVNRLCQAKQFEQFVHKRYLGQKRFSLEGAEVMIPMIDALFEQADSHDCREIILGMAHRGRLNVQVNIMGKLYESIFREFEDQYNPEGEVGTGDVKYHKGFQSTFTARSGNTLDVIMANNPSHLESVDPVAVGMARARLDTVGHQDGKRVLPVLLHGDAAFAAQGVVAETLNMAQLEGYGCGGTVHIVINNQIGYTTLPEDARSTRYSTDIAKGMMVPIFHVHGEDPEAVDYTIRLACDYRMAFGKDVVIDVVCYRLYGHNEGDEPYFTQPLMYERIRQRPSLDESYAASLIEEKVLTEDELKKIRSGIDECLETAHKAAKTEPESSGKEAKSAEENGASFYERFDIDTAVKKDRLTSLAQRLNDLPEGFNVNSRLKKLLEKRRQTIEDGKGIDWGNAESLAFATLLEEGYPIRLSGEDTQRGTFSQRHSVLFDTKNNAEYIPLSRLSEDQAPFFSINSPLSEAGVLGFEYGYSLMRTEGLVLWEAQFGDFVNNAQVVIDQFITSGEAKWQNRSGLVMLLPHGHEGMGPEHSSARIERFLQLCAEDNIQVCVPSTPAQYFHMLRRQAVGDILKPLVIMTPKSLLRHPMAVSALSDFTSHRFEPVLGDPSAGKSPEKVIFVSGKIYYELLKAGDEGDEAAKAALIRVEQLYPFPEEHLRKIINRYKKCKQWLWVQEEPENQGAWPFMADRFRRRFSLELTYIGRDPSSSPATGYHHVFAQEQQNIVLKAISGS